MSSDLPDNSTDSSQKQKTIMQEAKSRRPAIRRVTSSYIGQRRITRMSIWDLWVFWQNVYDNFRHGQKTTELNEVEKKYSLVFFFLRK